MRNRIVVAGSIAQKPYQGGHAWVFLQYVLGLRRLGWDVLFLDRLEPDMCCDRNGIPCAAAASIQLAYLRDLMASFGLDGSWSLLVRERSGPWTYGVHRRRVLEHVRDAELLLNVMGFLDDEEILAAARRRVFLDIDPGFGQMWRELGHADLFAGHDELVTIGLRIGQPDCRIPDCGLRWLTTLPPIVLDQWPEQPPAAGRFTTVASWRGRYAPVEFRGETYGLRVHEFRKIVALPTLCDVSFELALDIDPAERADLELLARNGWSLVEPRKVAPDPRRYRDYIAGSGAELLVPKDAYVRSRGGWFSDRSVCYLASGRPVVARDTGFSDHLPSGDGLLVFEDLEQARAAVEEVSAAPRRHSRAARELAEELFDSDKVLGRLLDRLGVESGAPALARARSGARP
jgi:hypothetical protein